MQNFRLTFLGRCPTGLFGSDRWSRTVVHREAEARKHVCDLSNCESRGVIAPFMLRVQKRRRPEDWEKRLSSLSGRFLPLDPADEAVLDVLERRNDKNSTEEDLIPCGPEGPPSRAYGTLSKTKWSKRAEAAKKRWADPAYRAKMLAMRAEKRQQDIEAGIKSPPKMKRRVQIGRLDSITLSSEEKAKAINSYALSNKRRSEKLTLYHRDQRTWIANRLSSGEQMRFCSTVEEYKKQRQEARQAIARKRHSKKRAKVQLEALSESESNKIEAQESVSPGTVGDISPTSFE